MLHFFAEDKQDIKNKIVMFLIGTLFLIFGIRYIQIDITTTAKFFDSLGLQPVLKDFMEGGITIGAWMFGVSMSLIQVYFSYKIVMEHDSKVRRWYWMAYIFSAIFDTYTDIDYRSFGLSMNNYLAIKSLFVSFFVYNLFSEWAIGIGFRESAVNGLFLIDAIVKKGRENQRSFRRETQFMQRQDSGRQPPQYQPRNAPKRQ